ncbi:MAG: 1-acyl-sn-glycerol-3-phosphate acyltransferase [Deltaproteobacteria bacterium]|nr:MAG: 1-acyl-sn-glycerol-3-phosphate acyltransferase [Deltaproteobacteria bacterium]
MDTFREKTFYPYVLDHKPGFFLSWFLYRLFKSVGLDENMKEDLKQMHREGTVVYAIKYRGQLDYLLYHYNFRRRRLPYPKIAFDLNMSMVLPFTHFVRVVISQLSSLVKHGRLPSPYQSGFYKRAIQRGTTSLIFLVDPKGFIRHFIHAEKDHLQFLLETQKDMDRPIFIVPQLVLYKKTPERDHPSLASIFFGFKDHPGVIRKIVLFFRHHRRAFIDFGRPLDLKAYLRNQPSTRPLHTMAAEIRQMLIEGIDMQKRVILGPIMKSRQEIKELVLTDERVSEKIENMAYGDDKQLRHLRKEAGEYFDEIAADYNMTYIQAFIKALDWFWKKIFEGVIVDEAALAKVREWARRGPLIYVPSHKSHIDYLILNHVIFSHHLHVPRIAAGTNLAFWPMGHIFRKCGAFFIRRSLKGAKLYSEVLARYIKALLEEGHPIEFFIEGGRSRNGKLMLPKTGFLSILLQAYHEGFCNDLIFIPASITYDRILEEKSYLKEIGGDLKERESFGQIIRARRFLKRRYGKIYIRFNHPFSLNDYLSQKNPPRKDIRHSLAFHLVKSINAVSLVTPLSLTATAILSNHRRGFHLSELTETADILLRFLKRYEVPKAATLAHPSKAVKETLSLFISWKIIDFLEDAQGEEETFYYVDEDKKMELEYYKNSIIHFFIPHSLVAISFLTGSEEVKNPEAIVSDYTFLKNLFKHEFVFDENESLEEKVTSLIEYFLDSAFLSRSEGNGGYKITKLGFDNLPIWAALAKTFLESYWIAIKSIGQQKDKWDKRENLLKNMNYLGRRFHKLGIIDHIGALSQLNFTNALSFINEDVVNLQEISEKDRSRALERLSQLGQRVYELSHYRA